jgi:hypothetical protein
MLEHDGEIVVNLYNASGEQVLRAVERPHANGTAAFTELQTSQLRPGVYYLYCRVVDQVGRQRRFIRKIAIVH